MTRASMAGCRPVRRDLLASAGSANFTTVLRPQWTKLTLAHRRQVGRAARAYGIYGVDAVLGGHTWATTVNANGRSLSGRHPR